MPNYKNSHAEAQAILRNLAETRPDDYRKLRRIAAESLEANWPEGEGMGSSDISCEAISLIQYEDWEALLSGDTDLPIYGS